MQSKKLTYIAKFLFVIFFVSSFFFAKKWFSFLVFLLFLPEYLYLSNFLFNIYKNYNEYYLIEVSYPDICSLNIFEAWLEICKLQAFKRVYILLSKEKKLNLKNILFLLIIILFSIPIKFLSLSYYFLVSNKHSFRDGLNIYYTMFFNLIKKSKIEILNKNIYLNCNTLGKLISSLTGTEKLSHQTLFDLIIDLRMASSNFNGYEYKNQELVEMKKTAAFDKNNKIIYDYHYAYIYKKNSIHATSKLPIKYETFQEFDLPMPSLIKKEAANPASVVTKNITKIKESGECLWIPKYEINSIKCSYLEIFDLNKDDYKYMCEKNQIYKEIFLSYNLKLDDSILKALRTNLYTQFLINSSNKDIESLIEVFQREDIP